MDHDNSSESENNEIEEEQVVEFDPEQVPIIDTTTEVMAFTKKPDHYSGEDPDAFAEWLQMFDVVSKVNKWDEAQQLLILPSYLTNYAFQVYEGLTDAEKATYGELKTNLKDRIVPGDRAMLLEIEFSTLNRKLGESIDGFLYRLRKAAKRAFPDKNAPTMNALVRKQFILGQERDLQFQLLQLPGDKNLDAVILTARTYEAAAQVTKGRVIHMTEDRVDKMDDKRASNLVLGKVVKNGSGVTCYKCGREGHISRDCKFSGQESNNCYECGQAGHIARYCTRRSMGQLGRGAQVRQSVSRQYEVICYKCNKKGHLQHECRSNNEVLACQRCGNLGHIAQRCRTDISLRCGKCSKMGHTSAQCRRPEIKTGAVHNVEYGETVSRGVRYVGNPSPVGFDGKDTIQGGYEGSGNISSRASEREMNWTDEKNDGVPISRGDGWDQEHH